MSDQQNTGFEVYVPAEIAKKLRMRERNAYSLCKTTTDFNVIRIGRLVRIEKQSFDNWFHKLGNQL